MRVTVSFFRKYAGGTLLDTSSLRIPAFRCTYMNKYQYLLSKKESGELSILFELGLPVHLSNWLEYYAYHLAHPELSQLELSIDLNVGHSTIQRALAFMTQELVLISHPQLRVAYFAK